MQASQLLGVVAGNLQGKGYSQIIGPAPLSLGMFKQAAGFGVPKLVGVVANTDQPSVNFARAAGWMKKTMGRSGAGLLLLVVVAPPQNYIVEALGQGRGALGYGQVVCGVYDLSGNSYYLPQGDFNTTYMAWDQDSGDGFLMYRCVLVSLLVFAMGCPGNTRRSEKAASSQTPPGELPPELERYRPAIEKSRLDTVHITAHSQKDAAPWTSRFGGKPYFPKGHSYPTDPKGRPLALIAQLNFAEMPPLDGYPTKGLLQFFIASGATDDHIWGSVSYKEEPYDAQRYFRSLQDQRYFRVLYHPDVTTDRNQLQEPPAPSNAADLPISGEARLSFDKQSETVHAYDYRFASVFGKDAVTLFSELGDKESPIADGYIAFSHKLYLAKIGGYASFVQHDPRAIQPSEDWLLLLEIQSFDRKNGVEIMWGDSGVGGLFIRRTDLANLDFSKVAYYWDNH